MSTLYGDNIFESSNMAIDRLFESINNDFKLFDGLLNESVINESAKDALSKIINKIKEAIRKIKAKIAEVFGKLKGNLIYNKTIKDATNAKLPFSFLLPNMATFNKFIDRVMDYYKLIENAIYLKLLKN